MQERYADLEIRILEKTEQGYPVEITLDGQREFERGYLSADILPWVPTASPVADGERLCHRLLADRRLLAAWAHARGQSHLRRIRLRIDPGAAELHALPWELLCEEGRTLAADAATPFSRYLPVSAEWGGAVDERPLRVLAVLANPTDVDAKYHLTLLDEAAERRALEQAFAGIDEAQVQLTFLEPPIALRRLEEELRAGYHVLHWVGHGAFSPGRGASLFLQAERVAGDAFTGMLARLGALPHLVFLAACQSATRSTADAFAGLAPRLVSIGVPAVLAMQDLVTVDTARTFAETFYRRLLAHGQVDRAANEARSTLLVDERPDAAVPVLFMRLEDGRLLDVGALPDVGAHGRAPVMSPAGEARAPRDLELAYLDALLEQYEHWREHYTPLAGIAEVRAAVADGPRLDLPMPFVPREFARLVEHGLGGQLEVRRVPVDDLRRAVAEQRRVLLLGDPGSGKTTTLWRLACDDAEAARRDGHAPLPLLVPLGGYGDDLPFEAYLARHLGPLAPYLQGYLASSRLSLLLDGLNEMPQARYAERVRRIGALLGRFPDVTAVVTCRAVDYRALDYTVPLEGLQKVEVSPLDPDRIRVFVHNYLGAEAGERLFWALAGGDEVRALWETWQGAGGTWEAFWTADEMPRNVYDKTSVEQDRLWERLRREPPAMLSLCGNPYMLLMTAQVYALGRGVLPDNRARLLAAFVDTLLAREEERRAGQPPPTGGGIAAGPLQEGLAGLAYAMQEAGGRGTTVERGWALEQVRACAPGCDAERLLYQGASATLLDAGQGAVRFYHQLLQEYFAARELGRRAAAGGSLARYWPGGQWWAPTGWEETAILAAGMEADASSLVEGLAAVHPALAARCLLEGGA